jgi:hypothetical protein
MLTLGKKLAPLTAVLVLVLAGCGDVRTCSGFCGGQTDPPFTATLAPTYLLAQRGETMAGPLIVDIHSEYPFIPFTVGICLRKQDNSFPPPGIYLAGTDPNNPWSCLIGGVEGTARYELLIALRPDVVPGIYRLRLQVANEYLVRNLDFTLEVR